MNTDITDTYDTDIEETEVLITVNVQVTLGRMAKGKPQSKKVEFVTEFTMEDLEDFVNAQVEAFVEEDHEDWKIQDVDWTPEFGDEESDEDEGEDEDEDADPETEDR